MSGYFEGKSEEEARNQILTLVGEYCRTFHGSEPQPYVPGERIPYASRVYDEREMTNLVDSALEFWLTMGRYTEEFERGLASYLGVRHALAVSSGSSANLLAFMALTCPELGDRAVRRGDEVITVAAGFPTTITPILNFGAVPVFVDIKLPSYNVDETLLEPALSERTKAVMLAHTLGNPFNLKAVREFCDRHGLWLIEDNCDALGSRYFLDGEWHMTGTVGDIGTSSFYPPHHMTMGEGGAVYTDDPLLFRLLRSLRDWGRDCICVSGQDGRCGHRFDGQYGELPPGYDHKYVYSTLGYNLGITDMQAAVGLAQLEKLPLFTKRRREHWQFLREALNDLGDRVLLPEAEEDSKPSWFGFCMTLADGIDRRKVLRYIESHGVQTRLLFAGNMTRQPCLCMIRGTLVAGDAPYRIAGMLTNSDIITEKSFWLGVYPGLDEERLSYMADTVRAAVGSC